MLMEQAEDQEQEEQEIDISKFNDSRPPNTEPIPKILMSKFGDRITDVWWNAKGRNGPNGDPSIGVEIDGIRKTFSGYVWNEWWYFQKVVHKSDDLNVEPNQCYFYRKKKISIEGTDEFETIEEYVGAKLIDLDTNLPINVPFELQHHPNDLCPQD